MKFSEKKITPGPRLYTAAFHLDKVGDTFLDMRGWKKGCVWVNNHNLGRFWYIGPQQTLYLPGVWLKYGANEIVVLELEEGGHPKSIEGIKEPVLNQLVKDELAPPLPEREEGRVQLIPSDMVKEGSFTDSKAVQEFTFTPVTGRYICLQSLSSQKSDPFASMAEFNVIDEKGTLISRDGWKVKSVDSEELTAEDGRAENVFDDDPETIWHSLWSSSKPNHPHYIALDLGELRMIDGFRYLSRQGDAPGKIKEFRLYIRKSPFGMQK